MYKKQSTNIVLFIILKKDSKIKQIYSKYSVKFRIIIDIVLYYGRIMVLYYPKNPSLKIISHLIFSLGKNEWFKIYYEYYKE